MCVCVNCCCGCCSFFVVTSYPGAKHQLHTHTHTHLFVVVVLNNYRAKKTLLYYNTLSLLSIKLEKNAQFLYFFCCFLSIYIRARVCVCLLFCLCMYILNISLIISVSLRRRIIILHAHREACKYSHRFFFAIRFKCV